MSPIGLWQKKSFQNQNVNFFPPKKTTFPPLICRKDRVEFSRSDRVSLYLELSECYRMDGQNQEAARVMQEAMQMYQGKRFHILFEFAKGHRGGTVMLTVLVRKK